MSYQVVSFNHKNCEQDIREKLAFATEEEIKSMLGKLTGFEFIEEAYIVSTCNRVEIVLATKDAFSSYHAVLGMLSLKSGLSFFELKEKRWVDGMMMLMLLLIYSLWCLLWSHWLLVSHR